MGVMGIGLFCGDDDHLFDPFFFGLLFSSRTDKDEKVHQLFEGMDGRFFEPDPLSVDDPGQEIFPAGLNLYRGLQS